MKSLTSLKQLKPINSLTPMKPIAADMFRAARLLPASLARSGAVLTGRRPRTWRDLLHAVMGIPLGVLSLIAVGLELLFVARGVLYGLVDRGPYTHSWGGPTRAGAWLAHFTVGLPIAAAGLALLWFIALLHDRLGARFVRGERTGAWALPTALLLSVAGALFVVAWLHQL